MLSRRLFLGTTAGAAGLFGWFGRMRFRPQRRLEESATITTSDETRFAGGLVALDHDGYLKPLSEISYKPVGGWQAFA